MVINHANEEITRSPAPSINSTQSDICSIVSETSTIEYEQESWVDFGPRVEVLCRLLWPQLYGRKKSLWQGSIMRLLLHRRKPRSSQPPIITRAHGGDFNRIVNITIPSSKKDPARDFILRVPRWGQGSIIQLIDTLEYVRHNSQIPVAAVEKYDSSCDNPLRKPYILQHRLPGADLERQWDTLLHSQRCEIAREIGSVIKSLLSLQSPVTGHVRSHASVNNGDSFTVAAFHLTDTEGIDFESQEEYSLHFGSRREKETTLDLFKCQISRWRTVDEKACVTDRTIELWDKMDQVVNEMGDRGLLETGLNCLCHTDLYPRNIMAQTQSDDSIHLSGILDWDEAVIAPNFVCCEPPAWLWGFKAAHTYPTGFPTWPYEAPGANDEPSNKEQKQIKMIFEEQMGPAYLRLAYDAEYRILRGLSRVMLFGLTSSENYDATERLISDWEALCR